jgi:RNA polymerase subunit RPABC4/transcription elongation factor Spt4
MAEIKKCVECEAELPASENKCPKCGAEQPVKWMVWLVYALLALFVIGAIYRLFVP